MDSNSGAGLQVLSIQQLNALRVGPDFVVRLPDRNALREDAVVVRIYVPFGLLLVGAANVNRHAIQRSVVRTPYGTVDKGVVLRLRLVATVQGSCGCQE